jgi:hypothetical protein
MKQPAKTDFTTRFFGLLASRKFFYFVLALAALQGVWYALGFAPTIYDERVHLGIINAYSHHLSPFISKQPHSLDYLGQITSNSSYLYYYLMSWPLRLMQLFTDNAQAQVIFLRLLNVAMFTGGLFVYGKLLYRSKVSRAITNIALLLVILIPATAPLPGAVNYDNAVFLLSGLLLYLAVSIIAGRSLTFKQAAGFLILGLLGSLVKFEFLALFAPVALYVLVCLYRRGPHRVAAGLVNSFKKMRRRYSYLLLAALIISLGLFIERPVVNELRYHNVNPQCEQILNVERCQSNYTAARNIALRENKPANFMPVNPVKYFVHFWAPGIMSTQTVLLGGETPFRAMTVFSYGLTTAGVILILLYLRDFLKKKEYRLLLVVMAAYGLLLAAYNYDAYREYASPVAITGRYLLPVMPIFVFFALLALVSMLRKYPKILLLGCVGAILLLINGGGIITYMMDVPPQFYWPDFSDRGLTDAAKDVIQPVIRH